jgi:N-acetylmuramoyl-L-alanine amidase
MLSGRYFRAVVLLLAGLALASTTIAADPGEQTFVKARAAYRQLLDSSRRQLYRDNWDRIIDNLERVTKRYPRHGRAADALYLAGKACEGLYRVSRRPPDARRALTLYDRLTAEYPRDGLTDDGYYLAGLLLEQVLKEPAQAWQRFSKAVKNTPRGDMVPLARKGLARLARYAPPPAAKPASSKPRKPAGRAGPVELQRVRYWSSPGYTRVVLELTGRGAFSTHLLSADARTKEPRRLYVDIRPGRLAKAVAAAQTIQDGLLRRIRTGRPAKDTVRVVLDLESYKDYKVFPLEDPHRIVIDVSGDRSPAIRARNSELRLPPDSSHDPIARELGKVPDEKPPKVAVPARPASGKLRRIVVDPGHGGKDPGAIGPSGTQEKDITLAMALSLAKRLEKDLGCQVILTRKTDVYLALEERTAIANRVGADLFISIHANASRNRKARGIETYYLNFSKNDKAAAVAARENGTSLKQVSDLEMILFDLMANAKINESSRLASEIQNAMVKDLSRHFPGVMNHGDGVRQGPFYVLLGANMPSVLVETAFISNKKDEALLRNSRYRDHAARAIVRAVKNFDGTSRNIANK